jgi:hypothetical protein
MKTLFIVMLAIMITSLALLCRSIISGDLVMFAFSTGVSLISLLGTCVLAGELDDRRI